jgi:hypothetical protein
MAIGTLLSDRGLSVLDCNKRRNDGACQKFPEFSPVCVYHATGENNQCVISCLYIKIPSSKSKKVHSHLTFLVFSRMARRDSCSLCGGLRLCFAAFLCLAIGGCHAFRISVPALPRVLKFLAKRHDRLGHRFSAQHPATTPDYLRSSSAVTPEIIDSLWSWNMRNTGISPSWKAYVGKWDHYKVSSLEKATSVCVDPETWASGTLRKCLRQKSDDDSAFELWSVFEDGASGDFAQGALLRREADGHKELRYTFVQKPWRMTRLSGMFPGKYPPGWPDEADALRVTIVKPGSATFSGVPYMPTLQQVRPFLVVRCRDVFGMHRFDKYTHACIHAYIHTYIRTYIYIHIHTYVSMYTNTCIHIYIHTCMHTYIYTNTCIHVCVCTYMHA